MPLNLAKLAHDLPMSLGDHLDEIRKRLMRTVILFALVNVVMFTYGNEIKSWFQWPLDVAIGKLNIEQIQRLGIKQDALGHVLTENMTLVESVMNSLWSAAIASIALIMPYAIYQVWAFCAPALKPNERGLAFMFVPLAMIFFYLGVVLGYLYGLTFFFSMLLHLQLTDPSSTLVLRQSWYLDFFLLMTVCFGFLMDIPWLVLVLVRTGMVHPDTFAKHRKIILMALLVFSCLIAPPEIFSTLLIFGIMVVLWEGGVLAARLLYGNRYAKKPPPNLPGIP